MFSIFKKNLIKIISTKEGSHGDHWLTLYKKPLDSDKLWNRFEKTADIGTPLDYNNLVIITDSLIRVIAEKTSHELISGFPYFKGSLYHNFETDVIIEWLHVDNTEAIIKVSYPIGCQIGFFATDYAFNKNSYTKQKNISLNIVGLAYSMTDFEKPIFNNDQNDFKIQLADDFCTFFSTDACCPDNNYFVGIIKKFETHNLGEIEGFIVTLDIIQGFSIEIFIAKINLQTDLEINKHVSGYVWMQGTLEK